ncbi:hypothetical protein F0562_031888 [Nyssa sinensis]|uniref:Uncharacterized protein n=1 Tax=Nyssa sinensis TaxID=561372 RepID=A0A5J5AZF5_9ASTE|nr:hypothetical protein F0562_031888 [Nyssa sinensis]
MNHLALDANCHPSEYYYASALVPRYLNPEGADGGDISLDELFSEDDSDVGGDASDSDGFLSEESSCPHIAEGETASILEGNIANSDLLVQDGEIHKELAKQKNKLDMLKEKDPEFSKFLENYKSLEPFRNEEVIPLSGWSILLIFFKCFLFYCPLLKHEVLAPSLDTEKISKEKPLGLISCYSLR